MTGGLQDQVTDGEQFFGIGLQPSSKAIIGSQQVPYIYEDRLNKDDFVNALVEMYELGPDRRAEIGLKAREWTQDRFNFDKYIETWDELFTSVHENEGSWDTRKNYQSYEVRVY